MTTTTLGPPTEAARKIRLRAAVAVAAIGPLAIAALRWVLPYDTSDDPAALVAKVAANPGAQSAVIWLGYLALLTLPLGVLVVAGLAMRARPVLGGIGAVLAWIGFSSLAFLVASDQATAAAVTLGLPHATATALTIAVDGSPAASVATGAFVIGHILGAVLLGVALWRVIPRWAALALIVSQPLHLVFAVIAPNHLFDALAWTLTAVGFTAAARAASVLGGRDELRTS